MSLRIDYEELRELLCEMLVAARNNDRATYRQHQDKFLAKHRECFGEGSTNADASSYKRIYDLIAEAMSRAPEDAIADMQYSKNKNRLLDEADEELLAKGKDCQP